MSLVITSNINLNDRVEESEIHKPYSYHNRLNDTMKIPKDSEIAVQSVKINKNGLQSLNRMNSTFATYWGRPLNGGNFPVGEDEITDTPFHPHISSVVEFDGVKELTTREVAEEMTQSLKSSLYCPHMFTAVINETDAPEADIACEVKVGQNGEFQGYEIDAQFNTDKVNAMVDPADIDKVQGTGEKDFSGAGGRGISWSYFTGQTDLFMSLNTNEQPNVGGAQVVLKDFPVALNSTGWNEPSIRVYIPFANGVDSEWAVGLVRDCDAQLDNMENVFVGYRPEATDGRWGDSNNADGAEGWGRGHHFYDYVMVRKGDYLRIYQAVVSSNRQPTARGSKWNLVMKEIKYWLNPNSPLAGQAPYNIATNNQGFQYVGWVVDGDCVEPYVENGMGMSFKLWDNQNVGTTKDLTTKPRGSLNNVLYPKLWIRKQFDNMTIFNRTKPTLLQTWTASNPNADWVVRLNNEGTYLNWGREVETRNIMDYNPLYDGTKYSYERTDGQSNIIDYYKPVLIFAPSLSYKDNFTRMCNSQYLMGFLGKSLQDSPIMSVNGVNSLATFSSAEIPLLTSQKSLFVKLTNFSHSTANAKRGQNHSKLLAHLPRFDNAGNEVGGLFFEPHERVYVSLNNAQELYLNEFDVEIVYDDETYAECISGKTIVCFHIRSKKK